MSEGQIARQDHAAALVAFDDYIEDQVGLFAAKRQAAPKPAWSLYRSGQYLHISEKILSLVTDLHCLQSVQNRLFNLLCGEVVGLLIFIPSPE
jgi:hypothetical protein